MGRRPGRTADAESCRSRVSDFRSSRCRVGGDGHGMPSSNSYRTYNANGTSNSAGSFVYWTDPNNDGSHDANQAMIYSDSVPAADTKTNSTTPAPWVPWTRAGCDVGNVSTAN